jgi:hypothetical protein
MTSSQALTAFAASIVGALTFVAGLLGNRRKVAAEAAVIEAGVETPIAEGVKFVTDAAQVMIEELRKSYRDAKYEVDEAKLEARELRAELHETRRILGQTRKELGEARGELDQIRQEARAAGLKLGGRT